MILDCSTTASSALPQWTTGQIVEGQFVPLIVSVCGTLTFYMDRLIHQLTVCHFCTVAKDYIVL